MGASNIPLWGQFLVEAAKLLVSAMLSAFVAVKVVNRLKSQSDHVEKRIDDICSDIRAVADLASEYWVRPPANELRPIEARIQARISLIERLRNAAASVAPELAAPSIEATSAEFMREATGGDFGVHNRAPAIDRATSVQHAATRYIGAIRRERLSSHGAPRAL